MPLPKKAVYTISEAAKYIASAAGERVTQSQIIDWGKQGLYGLYMRTHDCHVKYEGSSEVVDITGSLVQFDLNDTQTATLEEGYSIQIERGKHDGRKVIFMKSPEQLRYARWPEEKPADFNCTSVAILGTELEIFIESIGSAPAPVETAISNSEREKLLRQIGVLALVLAEKNRTYKLREKPNASKIATDAVELLAVLPDAKTIGAGHTSICNSIREGIKLLQK